MRSAARSTPTTVRLASVDGYHASGNSRINYAHAGFKANKYFTSDRTIKLDERFNRPDGKPLKGYGLEIETECNGITRSTAYAEVLEKIIFPHFPADLFKLQRDASLGGTSAECITQVMTKEFIRNNYHAFKLMYDTYFPAFGVSCSRTGNCGMHVNISNAVFGASEKAQTAALRKLLYVVNRHFDTMCEATCRPTTITSYCSKMAMYTNAQNCKTADMYSMPASHYVCCNFSHFVEGRVELRFVGGQPTFAAFRNTMETIFHLVEAVKTLSWDDLQYKHKIFAGCNQYVFDRLKTKCRFFMENCDALEEVRKTVKCAELI